MNIDITTKFADIFIFLLNVLIVNDYLEIFIVFMTNLILDMLPESARRKSGKVAFAVLLRSILDFAGVAALIPLLMAVLRPGSSRVYMLMLCACVLLFVVFKHVLVAVLARVESSFQMDVYRDFSRRMFVNYYNRGLMFLKGKSSVQLGHEVNFICYSFCLGVLKPLFRMVGDTVLIVFMMAALIIWEPFAGLLLCAAFIPLAVVYTAIVRKRLRRYGEEELEARRRQSRTVVEAFRGYPELEIARAFDTSLASFDNGMEAIVNSRLRMEKYQLFPQFLSETAIVAGIALLVASGKGDLGVVSGIFAVAAFRLIPAMRSILNSWVVIQNARHSVQVVKDGLEENGSEDTADDEGRVLSFGKGLEVRNLGFSFPDGTMLFSGLDMHICKGERVGVKGVSGSGKSTLFNILLGFIKPTEGEVLVDGRVIDSKMKKCWHAIVGYVPQEIFIVEGTLVDNVALGDSNPDKDKVMKVLEQVQLADWAGELPQGLDTPLGEYGSRLSGGQKQRIGIARALYKDAEVLFFDEATSALDSGTEAEINKALEDLSAKCREITMIIIAHRESSLALCNRIINLDLYKSVSNRK